MEDLEERTALGQRLAAARRAAGLTGEAVAAHFGYKAGRKTVSAWETGLGVPTALILRTLCRLYGCTADSLLWESPAEVPGAPLALTPAYRAKLAALQPEQVDHIRRQVELAVDSFHLTAPAAQPEKRRRA